MAKKRRIISTSFNLRELSQGHSPSLLTPFKAKGIRRGELLKIGSSRI